MIQWLYNNQYIRYGIILLPFVFFVIPLPAFAIFEETFHDFVVAVFGFFVWLAGLLLDLAFNELVKNMGGQIINNGIGAAVDELWATVRDFFNILFIFGLIYIGFRTILYSDDANTKRALGWLIVAALLINFSLFITKGIVDISNLTAIQIHSALTDSTGGNISDVFMRLTSLSSMFSSSGIISSQITVGTTTLEGGPLWTYLIAMMVLFIVASITFFSGAFMLVARFIALLILMILSPVMFVGWIFPKFDTYAKQYWDMFLKYAFFAPAYMFALFISAKVLKALHAGLGLSSSPGMAQVIATGAGTAGGISTANSEVSIFLFFVVAVGFMIGSVIVGQKMGIAGAATTMSVFGKMKDGVQSRVKNTGMLPYRAAVGAKNTAVRGAGSVARRGIGNVGAKWDKKLEERGYSSKGLVRGITGGVAGAKFGTSNSAKDILSAKKDADAKGARYQKITDLRQSIASVTAAEQALKAAKTPEEREEAQKALNTAKISMERNVSGASNEQLVKVLGDSSLTDTEHSAIVNNMKENQYSSVMKAKEEDLNDTAKTKIASTRQASVTDRVINSKAVPGADDGIGPVTEDQALAGIPKATSAELKSMGVDTVTKHAGRLAMAQIEDIKKSDDYTATEKKQIIDAHEAQLLEAFENSSTRNRVFARKDADAAKLPKKILTDARAMRHLTTGVLSEMKSTLDQEERAPIRARIEGGDSTDNPIQNEQRDWLRNTPRGKEF